MDFSVNELAVPTSNSDLVRFAEEASQVHGIAKALSGTSFVPKAMQGRPDEITGAILFGRELGLDPMTSLQTVHVIEGRPTLTANAMRGLATAAGVRFRLINQSDTRVTMAAKAPGDEQWTEVDWPIDRAKKMGLTNKSNWQRMPQSMLIARATSELCRMVAANVMIGCPYSSEEIDDLGPQAWDEVKPTSPAAPPKMANSRKYKRPDYEPQVPPPAFDAGTAYVPPAVPEVDAPKEIGYTTDDLPPDESQPAERDNPVSDNTRKAIMAQFNGMGVRGRNERLEKVSQLAGREIHSVNQLTEDEAKAVLRRLSPVDLPEPWSDVDVAEVPS